MMYLRRKDFPVPSHVSPGASKEIPAEPVKKTLLLRLKIASTTLSWHGESMLRGNLTSPFAEGVTFLFEEAVSLFFLERFFLLFTVEALFFLGEPDLLSKVGADFLHNKLLSGRAGFKNLIDPGSSCPRGAVPFLVSADRCGVVFFLFPGEVARLLEP